MIRRFPAISVFFAAILSSALAAEPIKVKVGGYPFEPFVEGNFGVTPGFVTLLNSNQDIYRFEFIEIPAQRRYEMMQAGKIDALFFEMMRWGWQDSEGFVSVTPPIIAGREVFVALKSDDLATQVLANPTEYKMALTLGYHYQFADYNADQAYLRQNFKIEFAPKQRTALRYLMAGQAQVAMASEIFLHHEYLRDAELQQSLLISEKTDQLYELPIMVRQNGAISVGVMTRILDGLVECDCLSSFFASYGLDALLVYPGK